MDLNYPKLQNIAHHYPLNEEWFLAKCKYLEEMYVGVRDLSRQMLVKTLPRFSTCIIDFENVKVQNTHSYNYDDKDSRLALDFNT